MLVRALLQTSLVLWLAQQTLQGGVKPQSVSWGRVLPARGVGIGVKPGVAGALGALGSRYGSKAMKTGIGRYPGAHLGVGGYRALGLGGRGGLKQGGYGTQGAYGASLGPGMAMGAGLTNGLGLGLGQAGKRGYGAGLGAVPGYGGLTGIGYPGARPGVSAADLVGPEVASLGQAVQDPKREKSRALGHLYGKQDRRLGPEFPDMRRSGVLGPAVPELHAGREVKSLDPIVQSPNLETPLDKQSEIFGLAVSQGQGETNDPSIFKRKGATSHEAALAAGGVRRQLNLDKDGIKSLGLASDLSIQQNQRTRNCGSRVDLSGVLGKNRFEPLGSETQRRPSLLPQTHVGEQGQHLGHITPQTQGEKPYQLPLSQAPDRSNIYSAADRQGVKGLVAKNGLRIRGTVTVENHRHGSPNLQVQAGGHYGALIPGASGTQSLGVVSAGAGQEAQGFTADVQDAKSLSQAEHDVKKPKALHVPGQAGRKYQAASYIGGPGNYLGASLGAGGYGPGLGQGAYLGGAAGKLGAAAVFGQSRYPGGFAGMSDSYGEGATGYLGAMAGNGFGYGNGYSDGYGAGLGYPADLADGAENKAGKSEALSTGGYAGQGQGAYGALGAGLDATGGKYGGGAAQVPYGNAPVIPAGLEGDGGYPYGAQQISLGAEGAKTANKYGAGAGYGAQQTGYGAQLGATQDALGEQTGKYGGVNGALGNGYKG
ncbi:spidroin-1 [Stegastes partitus]|uniref:Spidroin-1 n=1 Tax=Stegastes partitus TaxID=144197 RepID=A0A9Y4KN68_9TELE|nr:PREDICTED: spidroin-1-like [Stegastes partitus]